MRDIPAFLAAVFILPSALGEPIKPSQMVYELSPHLLPVGFEVAVMGFEIEQLASKPQQSAAKNSFFMIIYF